MEAIGGQALIEGVLMRNKNKIGISVRKSNGRIKTEKQNFDLFDKYRKIPFLRGIFVLIETLYLGTKALIYSANEATDEGEEVSKREIFFSIFFSVIFALGFFVLLPLYLTKIFVSGGILFNIVDGLLRVLVFVLYVIGISFMKDIKRVFQYHGAEHMAVHCYEHEKKLTVKNCRNYSTIHVRCGTNFLFIVLILSIIVFSFITSDNFVVKILSRIILIPVIASLSYEFLKLSAKFENFFLIKILTKPGLLLQKITTRKPDDKQIEVAISALKLVLK
ncbi:MAG: DUF1385 domain-containing protein [Nanoarchaeota archaeon]